MFKYAVEYSYSTLNKDKHMSNFAMNQYIGFGNDKKFEDMDDEELKKNYEEMKQFIEEKIEKEVNMENVEQIDVTITDRKLLMN